MHGVVRGLRFFILPIFAFAFLAPAPAAAAPQALALIATDGPIALRCDGDACRAEFSSFCLQQDRNSPPEGTAYRKIGSGAITVSATTLDGKTVTVPAESVLRFKSLRTHVAVQLSVPQSEMTKRGLRGITVRVGSDVTLAPVAVPGDKNPQDDASLAAAAGPLRKIGTGFVDSNDTRMAAARLTSRLINDLDADRSARGIGAQALWEKSVGDGAAFPAGARHMARGALNLCQFAVQRRSISDVGKCLQQRHDKFIGYLNGTYWNATGAGT